jgi:16S rRNA (cytidine1402-2'-O)-methyltransferase
LLDAYGLKKDLVRCDAHKEKQRADEIVARVSKGEIVALVSDAGTPAISDPGAALVGECHARGVLVVPIPGPSALTAALSASGFTHTSFAFLGFLPSRSAARRQILQAWAKTDAILALYEAPQRVEELLDDIEKMLGPRQIVIARELTKRFETLYRGTPADLKEAATDKDFKGEVVILIAPSAQADEVTEEDILSALETALQQVSLREAVAQVTAETGLPRKTIYALALKLQRDE